MAIAPLRELSTLASTPQPDKPHGAPCPTCAHAPVCRLRSAVEELAGPITSPDPAVHVTLAISCDHYLAAAATASPSSPPAPLADRVDAPEHPWRPAPNSIHEREVDEKRARVVETAAEHNERVARSRADGTARHAEVMAERVIPAELTRRQGEVLDALRLHGSRVAAGRALGVSYQSVTQVLGAAAAKGLVPDDMPDVPERLRPTRQV